MNTGDISTNSGNLRKAARILRARWEDTRDHWNDKQSHAFEEQCLDEIHRQVFKAADHIDRVAQLLARACRECS